MWRFTYKDNVHNEFYMVHLVAERSTTTTRREEDPSTPIILKQRSTVLDLAKEIHKDFVAKFQYARIWGSGRFDGSGCSETISSGMAISLNYICDEIKK
ncbi:MAG: hypothetical protein A2Z08_11800 [Deltaproteobacteria bacterium RBG_16_54_11]|nr:MAG: hypothetical protein A2Z08_11800 [Deltaproteobacteria bacterium RBG_16_54_11]